MLILHKQITCELNAQCSMFNVHTRYYGLCDWIVFECGAWKMKQGESLSLLYASRQVMYCLNVYTCMNGVKKIIWLWYNWSLILWTLCSSCSLCVMYKASVCKSFIVQVFRYIRLRRYILLTAFSLSILNVGTWLRSLNTLNFLVQISRIK